MTRGRKKRLPPGERSRDLPDRQAQEIERLKQENERLRKEFIEREKKIADLERQLALRQQNSTTTSKPPSSDGLAGQQRVRGRRVKSRRKAGGQPGHPGSHRAPVPIERVDTIIDLVPDSCRQCAHRLHARHGGATRGVIKSRSCQRSRRISRSTAVIGDSVPRAERRRWHRCPTSSPASLVRNSPR
jgi:hypothetical protein